MNFINAEEFTALLAKNESLNILDIRTDIEFKNLALEHPVNHQPLHDINPANFADPRADKNDPLYVLCKAGPRAQKITEFLTANDHKNLVVIDGGILGCEEHGAPLKHSEKPVSPPEIMAAIQDSVQKFMARYQ